MRLGAAAGVEVARDEKRDEKKALEEALALNKSLATAYYLKEDLRQFWEQPLDGLETELRRGRHEGGRG